jgi:hypothetical protein
VITTITFDHAIGDTVEVVHVKGITGVVTVRGFYSLYGWDV